MYEVENFIAMTFESNFFLSESHPPPGAIIFTILTLF